MHTFLSLTWLQAGGRACARRFLLTAAALLVATVELPAAGQITVTETSGVYTVSAAFTVPQTASEAVAVLKDYEHLTRFMPGLKKSTVVERRGGCVVLEQEATAKFLTFSKDVRLLLEVNELPQTIRFKDMSAHSFSQYEGAWRVSVRDDQTSITYDLVANPSFSVPEFLLRRLLKRDAAHMIDALQKEIAARAK